MLRHVMPIFYCCVTYHAVTQFDIKLQYVVLCHDVMGYHVMSCHVMASNSG